MQYFPSDDQYELGSCPSIITTNILYGVSKSTKMTNATNSNPSSRTSTTAEKAVAASKSHSEAERRRRKRINGHLATLRTLLPNTIKSDKASLLGEVVRRVKELKKIASELESTTTSTVQTDHRSCTGMIPAETDELELSYITGDVYSGTTVKASLCCEDRPELIPELIRALSSVPAKVVRAEIGTVGGRIKCVLWVQISPEIAGDEGLQLIRRGLKVVSERAALLALPGNKRPRLYHY